MRILLGALAVLLPFFQFAQESVSIEDRIEQVFRPIADGVS